MYGMIMVYQNIFKNVVSRYFTGHLKMHYWHFDKKKKLLKFSRSRSEGVYFY